MKSKFSSLLLGFILIVIGSFTFASQMGYLKNLTPLGWILIFASTGVLFFVAYLLNGIRSWGWLFPACIFSALAVSVALAEYSVAELWIPTLIIGSTAIPFFVAYFLERSRTWALIPAFILVFIAFIPSLSHVLKGEWMGGLIVAGISLFFFAAYWMASKNWWAIIPGGILLSVAFMVAFENILPNGASVAIMFLGWALTFGIVWKREMRLWAKIPVIVMGTLAGVMLLVTLGFGTYWALGLIFAGLALIVISLFRRTKTLAD